MSEAGIRGGTRRARAARWEGVNANRSRLVELAMRELLLLGIVALAAVLFINHGLLYLNGDNVPRTTRPEAYILATAIFYVFVRGVDIVLRMRAPRVAADLVLCPECGQELGDPTPKANPGHATIDVSQRPSERDVLTAVALRRAIDEARRIAARRGRTVDPVVSAIRGDFENAPAAMLREPEEGDSGLDIPRIPREPWRPKLRR